MKHHITRLLAAALCFAAFASGQLTPGTVTSQSATTSGGGIDTTAERSAFQSALSLGVVQADDFSRHADGTEIAHGSNPLTGPAYRLAVNEAASGTSPARYPYVQNGGLLPQGSGLMYIGGDLGETVKRMDFEITNFGTGGPNARNIFTIAVAQTQILGPTFNDAGFSFDENALHIECSIVGITSFGVNTATGTNFMPIAPTRGINTDGAAMGIWPWNPNQITGGGSDFGRPWRLTLEFEGNTCRVTAFGHTYEFSDPKIAPPRHWFWECRGIYPGSLGEYTILNRFAHSRTYADPFTGAGVSGRLADFVTPGRLSIRQETLIGAERSTFQVLTLSGNLSNNDTITLGDRTYTAKSSAPGTNQFLIGGNASATIDNLAAVINRSDGAGTLYGTSTAIHARAWAYLGAGDTLVAFSKYLHDTTLATTETAANASWGAATTEHKVFAWNTANLTQLDAALKVNGDVMASGYVYQFPTSTLGPFRSGLVTATLGAPVASTNAGVQTLSLMRGSQLLASGDTETLQYTGYFAANGNTKRFYLECTGSGGTDIWDSGNLTNNGEAWKITIDRYRAGSGSNNTIHLQITFETATTKIMPPRIAVPTSWDGPVDYLLKCNTGTASDIVVGSGRCVAYVK